jgi:hypothetical protein
MKHVSSEIAMLQNHDPDGGTARTSKSRKNTSETWQTGKI